MDNREFAKVLLCEASNLLTESAGRNNLAKKLADKGILSEKAKSTVDLLDSHKKHITQKNADTAKMGKEIDKYIKSCEKMGREPKQSILDMYTKLKEGTKEVTDGAKIKNDLWRDAVTNELSKYSKKSAPIHNKINERAKKIQNESIENTLNESIFKKINEKIFTSKKEMDEIVKQYTSIEGLHEYANKADAIVEFTKIKQGLNVDGSFGFTIKKINDAHIMYAFGKDEEDKIIFVYIAIIDKKGKVKAIERTKNVLEKIIKKKSK